MKKNFLKPLSVIVLSVVSGLTENIKTEMDTGKELSAIQQELINIKNYREGISAEDFLKPNDKVLTAKIVNEIEDKDFYHRSHYSHRSHSSHQSHRSHYSSYY